MDKSKEGLIQDVLFLMRILKYIMKYIMNEIHHEFWNASPTLLQSHVT